ncbi:MAG TPA: protein phosphatase 2C domain-containing protein [Burkholderiales bacterium]|nr:protein phosphatase 2C domain-containing protein [Burkholderiales bacterium]
MKYTIAQLSRPGARPYNQDRVGHWATSDALIMVVADGMGGHRHGDVAAQLALAQMIEAFKRDAKPSLANPDIFLFRSIGRVHAMLHQEARKLGLEETPRTVIVACVVQNGYAYWSHVGDSRLYLVRKGRVLSRTRDHTRVQLLLDHGLLREEALATHPDRNKVLQCLGGDRPPRLAPASSARLLEDDIVLLCSDGLWGPLTQRQLLHSLIARELEPAVAELVALAETRGGRECDNVSAVAMCWGENEIAPADEPHTLPFHELPTDVQDLAAIEPDFLEMTDEDIERAIADIRRALRKHTGPG